MSRRTIVIVVIVVLLAIAGVLAYQRFGKVAPNSGANLEIVRVERGTLEARVSATGSIAPEAEVSLSFKTAGRVVEVLIAEGDRVEASQVLARLETDELELQLSQARATLSSAEAQLAQVTAGPREEDIEAARAALDSAQATLDDLLSQPKEEDIELARLALEQARNTLWKAQVYRDSVGGLDAAHKQAEADVANAELSVRVAEIQYERAQEGPTAAQLAAARAQVKQARAELARLESSPTTEDIAIAQAQVDQAKASLEQAQSALDGAVIVAPFSGVVTMVNADVNELIAMNMPMVTLIDDSAYHISVTVDEADIGRVKEGQEVYLTLDAFRDQELEGHVKLIAPASTMDAGVVSYKVRIDIQPTKIPLRGGMTANAAIITESRENVLTLPNRAVNIDHDTDRTYVNKLVGSQIVKTEVITGMSNELVSEIVSGLEEGDYVVIANKAYGEGLKELFYVPGQ